MRANCFRADEERIVGRGRWLVVEHTKRMMRYEFYGLFMLDIIKLMKWYAMGRNHILLHIESNYFGWECVFRASLARMRDASLHIGYMI